MCGISHTYLFLRGKHRDGIKEKIFRLSVLSRYFMALVQEMAVKIDQGFLGAILALFTPAADPQADSEKVELPLLTC